MYEKAEHDRRLIEMLLNGEKDVAAGKLIEMEKVFKKADKILAKGKKN